MLRRKLMQSAGKGENDARVHVHPSHKFQAREVDPQLEPVENVFEDTRSKTFAPKLREISQNRGMICSADGWLLLLLF